MAEIAAEFGATRPTIYRYLQIDANLRVLKVGTVCEAIYLRQVPSAERSA